MEVSFGDLKAKAMLNQIALKTRGNKEFNRGSFAGSSNNGFKMVEEVGESLKFAKNRLLAPTVKF